MSGYLSIENIIIPLSSIEAIYRHFRKVGQEGFEGIGLFAGKCNNEEFSTTLVIIPEQKLYKDDNSGLHYEVDGKEIHRINVFCYREKLEIIAQIHSHPGSAYHSDTDDKFPIVEIHGCLSIVVPNFAFDAFNLKDWAVYRLYPKRGWVELSETEKKNLIKIKY